MISITYSLEKASWKRLGIIGFAFFLLKGLAWLTLPAVIYLIDIASR